QNPAVDGKVVRQRAGVVVRGRVGRSLLGIEVVYVDVRQAARGEVNGRRYQILLRGDPVKLAERVDPFLLLLVVWERQCIDSGLANLVFESFGKVELARQNRTFEIQPRRRVLEPAKVVAADAKLWERIVQFPLPLFAAAPRLHGHQAGGEAAELRQVGRLVDVQGLYAVDGHGEPELSCSGVGHIGRVDDQRAAVLFTGRDEQAASGLADHAGQQRQSVAHGGGAAGKLLGCRRR